MKKKKQPWMKRRHRIIVPILKLVVGPLSRIRYGIRVEKFRNQGKRPYLILYNHQTAFDQFFVAMAFKGPVYYLASEDLFSKGWVSSLIRWLVAPIPIKKQTTDAKAVMTCMRVAKEGGTIAIAPEGNRTYSGRTEYINPAIVSLARHLKLPVAFLRIEGGYGVHPRWSDKVRRGKMRAYVSRVLETEELAAMSADDFYQAVCRELYVDEAVADAEFAGKNLAEYLERAMYVCPDCGIAPHESRGDIITCKSCGKQIRYLTTKELEGVGEKFPFRFVADWYEYQKDFINKLDTRTMTETPVATDTAALSEVIVYKNKKAIADSVSLSLYGDRLVLDEGKEGKWTIPFVDASAFTVLGRNKLNIYYDDKVYQFKGNPHFNALKYVNFFYRFKNLEKGDGESDFLGL